MSRNRSWNVAFAFFVALVFALVSHAQAPTSRVIHYDNVQTDVLSTPGQSFRLQLFDIPTGGTPRYCEDQPLDTDAAGLISFDFGAGTPSAPPCPSSPPGLNPNDFTSGESRYLDVVDPSTGTSHLTARVPVKAVGFAVNPGPQGLQGIQGLPGQQGPPGVVQTVSAGDGSIAVGGTAADRLVSIAPNGVTNTHVANGALNPSKIAGTAATLGPNNFVGAQNVSGGTVTASNSNGVALDGVGSIVGVRGSAGANGFGIVGSAPANGTAGQFNGSVNVTGPLSAGSITTSGSVTAASFSGPISATSLNCTGCVGDTQLGVNYAGSASHGGPATNSLALGGVAPSGYAPAFGSLNYVAKSGDSMSGPLSATALTTSGSLRVEGGVSVGGVGTVAVDANGVVGGRLSILSNGNVGIGKASPARRLDVVGDASVSGTLSAGTLLGAGLSGMNEFTNDQNIPSAIYAWTAPPGVTHVMVDMWSGGQGGGSIAAGGGRGGTYSRSVVGVVPGTAYTIVVGGGGLGSAQFGGDLGFTSSMSLGGVTLINAVSFRLGSNPSIAAISRGGYGLFTLSFSGNPAFGATFCLGPLGDTTGRGGDINVTGNAGYVLLTW